MMTSTPKIPMHAIFGWCLLLWLSSVETVAAASSLRTSSKSSDKDLICQVFQTFEEEEDGSDKEFLSCELLFPEVVGTYELPPLPEKLMDQMAQPLLDAEPVFIAIPSGWFTADSIIVPEPHKVVLHSPTDERHLQRARQLRPSPFGGTLTVMVRVSTLDAEPDFSAQELRDYLFQMDRPSPKQQFEKCSVHQTTLMEPDWGVLDVRVDVNVGDVNFRSLPNLAEQVINTQIKPNGITNIRGHADVILFVLPPGTGGWAAYATINGKMSVYNNKWGGYMGAVMHELGHNFGIRHSYKNDKQYQGSTGYMGYQPAVPETPQRCYSAHGHYILNWYAFYTLDIGTSVSSTSMEMAAFVDTEMLTPASNMRVIGKAGDLYWQYNRKDKFNIETGEYPDQLVVWRNRNVGKGGTDLLGGVSLGQQETFTTNSNISINFRVCSQRNGNSQTPSSVVLVVGTRALSCPTITDSPTSNPTRAPVSAAPTAAPSHLPTTDAPSDEPTRSPITAQPTWMPSSNPVTMEPTQSPTTSSPTKFIHPTHFPTKSQAPTTAQPSAVPSTLEPSLAPITLLPTSSPVLPTATPSTREPSGAPSTVAPTIDDSTANGGKGVVLIAAPSVSPSVTVLPTVLISPTSLEPSSSPRPSFSPTEINFDVDLLTESVESTTSTNSSTAAVASSVGILAFVLIGGMFLYRRRSSSADEESYAAFENDDGGVFHKGIVRFSSWTTSSCTTGTLHSDRSLRSCSSFAESDNDDGNICASSFSDHGEEEAGLSTIPEQQWGRPAPPSKIFGMQPSWQVFHENFEDDDDDNHPNEHLPEILFDDYDFPPLDGSQAPSSVMMDP